MNTLTTIEAVQASGSSWVATLLGGKKAGTTDPALGKKLVETYERDTKNCLVEVALEKRDGRLWITSVDFIEAPEELGGPAEEGAASTTESGEAEASDSPEEASAPAVRDYTLVAEDELDALRQRVANLEGFLATTMRFEP